MQNDANRDRLEQALSSPAIFDALLELARTLKSEGMSQLVMYHLFTKRMVKHENDQDETRYDAIVEILTLIWGGGWAKGRGIFDTELTHEDVVRIRDSD